MKLPKTKPRGRHPNNKFGAVLTPPEVLVAIQLLNSGLDQRSVARRLNVAQGTVSFLARGLTWKELTVGRLFPPRRRLTPADVAAIRADLASGSKVAAVAARHKVSVGIVYAIKNGKTHKT